MVHLQNKEYKSPKISNKDILLILTLRCWSQSDEEKIHKSNLF